MKPGPVFALLGEAVEAFSYWAMRSIGVGVCGAASVFNPLEDVPLERVLPDGGEVERFALLASGRGSPALSPLWKRSGTS